MDIEPLRVTIRWKAFEQYFTVPFQFNGDFTNIVPSSKLRVYLSEKFLAETPLLDIFETSKVGTMMENSLIIT